MKRRILALLGVAIALILTVAPLAGASPLVAARSGWYAGDFHNHTYLTDGSYTMQAVTDKGLGAYGLTWMVNSEHGGYTNRTTTGAALPSPLPRWWTITNWSYPLVERTRARYPGRLVLQGVEWNVPEHDHASVGVVAEQPEAIAEFEYRFDRADTDTSLATRGLVKANRTHADALAAMAWLRQKYGRSSYVVINHPSRRLAYSARDIRELHDAAPGVLVGMEGMPGHQRKAVRGGYDLSASAARTYGGADQVVAKVGGVWDALLGEGRRLHVFANSDFHRRSNDFWPGQYTKNWVWLREPTSGFALVESMRKGRAFAVHGDLIDRLWFRAEAGGQRVSMGSTPLVVEPGSSVSVSVRFHSPTTGAAGNRPRVHHIDVIAGRVTAKALPGTPGYSASTNPSAKVIRTLPRSAFRSLGSGWYEAQIVVPNVTADTYLRLRGTNLAPGTARECDASGNPLSDSAQGTNTESKALADLWFYSNPVWIDVN